MSLHETELETAAAAAAARRRRRRRRRDGKHDDIMRSGDGRTDGQTAGDDDRQPQSQSRGRRRRRLLRDGSISRDRLNLDGRRNKIIDVFAGGVPAKRSTHTHPRTHARKHHKYSRDTDTALAESARRFIKDAGINRTYVILRCANSQNEMHSGFTL